MIGTVVSFCILLRHELVQCSLRCFESWKMGSEFEEVPVVIELGLCIMTLRVLEPKDSSGRSFGTKTRNAPLQYLEPLGERCTLYNGRGPRAIKQSADLWKNQDERVLVSLSSGLPGFGSRLGFGVVGCMLHAVWLEANFNLILR